MYFGFYFVPINASILKNRTNSGKSIAKNQFVHQV